MFELHIQAKTNKMSKVLLPDQLGSLGSKVGKLTCSAFNYCSELSLTFKTNRAFCRNPDSREGRLVCVPSDMALDAQLYDSCYQTKEPAAAGSSKIWSPFQLEASENHARSEFIFNENRIQDRRKKKTKTKKTLALYLFRDPKKLK